MPYQYNEGRSRRRDRSRSRSQESGSSRSRSRTRHTKRNERRQRRSGWDAGTDNTLEADTNLMSFNGGIGFSSSGAPALPPGGAVMASTASNTQDPGQSNSLAVAYHKRAMCRIYVGSLDYYLTVEEVKRVFQAFGVIVAVDMPKEGDRSKGFCFVEFATPESADMALSTMQGFILKGRSIKVGRPSAVGIPLPPPINAAAAHVTTDTNTLITPGVSGATMNPSQAGALAAAAVLSSRANYNVDINAILQKTGHGAIAAPQPAAVEQNGSACRIYVGNVPLSFTAVDLEKIFGVFGKILSCYLLPNPEAPGSHRGYGFIDFTEPEHARLSIETMNGFQVADKNLKVNYASTMKQQGVGGGMPGNSGWSVGEGGSAANVDASSATGANRVPLGSEGGHGLGMPCQPPASYNGGMHMMNDVIGNRMPVPGPPMHHPPGAAPYHADVGMTSDVVCLRNMVSPSEVDEDLKLEIRDECSNYGNVKDVVIFSVGNETNIFVSFKTPAEASRAVPQLHNRWFGGKQIVCHLYSKEAFQAGDYTLNAPA